MSNQPNQAIILFDGVCHFCSGAVQFIINRDRKGYFRFASLQSTVAKSLLADQPELQNTDSIILIENGQYFTMSTAVLRIAKNLEGPWKLLFPAHIIPSIFRDLLYRYFARHRYRWFGKAQVCMIPTAEMRERFLDL
ncbi:thiol-disulfide oxidoreductase DCC family protein [Ammoniphilus resinae]|uniref:DCC family thiol-disulfide oxidoreductase YuxK n=1 Tax=Ammoniphilus resinae TaxID=861532 RepID=A0ABS4GIW8_9BACL|nr:putative DCC family thiol-disulfide oxidoreductase YuxK [Ammoniphilus resinae]